MRSYRRWLYLLLIPAMGTLGGLSPALSDNAVRCQNRLVYIGDTTSEVLEKCGDPVWKGGWEEAPNRTVSRFYDYERNRYKAPESERGPLRIDVWAYDVGSNRFVRYLHFENGTLVRIETGEKGNH